MRLPLRGLQRQNVAQGQMSEEREEVLGENRPPTYATEEYKETRGLRPGGFRTKTDGRQEKKTEVRAGGIECVSTRGNQGKKQGKGSRGRLGIHYL